MPNDPFGRRIAKFRLDARQQPLPGSRTAFVWDRNRLLGERREGRTRQTVYVYEPESFVPLALLRLTGPGKEEPAPAAELDLPPGFPREWARLPAQAPEVWRQVTAMRRKTAAQLGVGFDAFDEGVDAGAGHARASARDDAPSPTAEIFYFHTDHLGTPQELTNAAGDVVWSARLSAWGATLRIEQPPCRARTIVSF